MNRTVTITSKNHKYQNTYGGLITEYDFCTDCPRKDKAPSVADRILEILLLISNAERIQKEEIEMKKINTKSLFELFSFVK